ncbi:hypothetical protein IJ818_04880 [bacterium]|nr:hypothetical protein [bacterium]
MIQNLNNIEYTNDFIADKIVYDNSEKIETLQAETQVIEGYFPKELYEKEMSIRKVNTALSVILGIFIMVAMTSYYFVTLNEMTLNKLSRETTALNDENAELQYKLDKLKSFSNVDITMQKNKTLTRAKQVIEVPEVNNSVSNVVDKKSNSEKLFSYSIGY